MLRHHRLVLRVTIREPLQRIRRVLVRARRDAVVHQGALSPIDVLRYICGAVAVRGSPATSESHSVALGGTRWHSVALGGTRGRSRDTHRGVTGAILGALRGHSGANSGSNHKSIKENRWQSAEAMRDNQGQSEHSPRAIRGNQSTRLVLKEHHERHDAIGTCNGDLIRSVQRQMPERTRRILSSTRRGSHSK